MRYAIPGSRDVLCGRGTTCHEHHGNIVLRKLIDRNLAKYAIAVSKSDKSSILREIIRSILQQGGRFLKKDSETENYYEAGMKAARDKVGHCLREAMAERLARNKLDIAATLSSCELKPVSCFIPMHEEAQNPKTQRMADPESTHQISMGTFLPSVVSDASLCGSHVLASQRECKSVASESQATYPIHNSALNIIHVTYQHSYDDREIVTQSFKSTLLSSKEDWTEIVDALYELPSQGEWEQLALPRVHNAKSGHADLVTA